MNDASPSGARQPKLKRSVYERELERLQIELCRLQRWVTHTGARVIVVFEGRDAAGKGGAIKRIRERVSPRVFRTAALPAPSDRERTQLYFQRYIRHFPAAGEVVLFDRSWYNRAGVEPVMGFCTPEQTERFLERTPAFEKYVTDEGVILIKFFFDVGQAAQTKRFRKRIADPLRHWKLSSMDIEAYRRWWAYTEAYARMIERTDTPWAPWYRVPADDKRRARLNCIAHLLDSVPYERIAFDPPKLGERLPRAEGAPEEIPFRHTAPQRY